MLLRASYRYSIYRKYRYQHIDTITGIPIGAFSIRIDIILTVVLWSRLDQGWSSTELFTKDINRHFLHLIRKAAYRLRLRCVNWQSKQTGPLSLPARDCWHQEGPVYKQGCRGALKSIKRHYLHFGKNKALKRSYFSDFFCWGIKKVLFWKSKLLE